jgi:hypothetical protein
MLRFAKKVVDSTFLSYRIPAMTPPTRKVPVTSKELEYLRTKHPQLLNQAAGHGAKIYPGKAILGPVPDLLAKNLEDAIEGAYLPDEVPRA